jgi:hypothetical protein
MNHFFLLDGEPVIQLRQEEQYSFQVAPGQHIVGAKCSSFLGSITNEASLNAQAGKTYIYRIYTINTACEIAPMSR